MNNYVIIHTHRYGITPYFVSSNNVPTEEQIILKINNLSPNTIEINRYNEMIDIIPIENNDFILMGE